MSTNISATGSCSTTGGAPEALSPTQKVVNSTKPNTEINQAVENKTSLNDVSNIVQRHVMGGTSANILEKIRNFVANLISGGKRNEALEHIQSWANNPQTVALNPEVVKNAPRKVQEMIRQYQNTSLEELKSAVDKAFQEATNSRSKRVVNVLKGLVNEVSGSNEITKAQALEELQQCIEDQNKLLSFSHTETLPQDIKTKLTEYTNALGGTIAFKLNELKIATTKEKQGFCGVAKSLGFREAVDAFNANPNDAEAKGTIKEFLKSMTTPDGENNIMVLTEDTNLQEYHKQLAEQILVQLGEH